ncbi:MAG: T9SS C-terminal target domain-containing protein [Calditrichaeota bacterium]|nr:MAG: T9SS C-terminal target domain-containing protein [Calditrichota bacterium]
MKLRVSIWVTVVSALVFLAYSLVVSKPSFNGPAPGCGPSNGCHAPESGIFSVTQISPLEVEVHVTGVQAGKKVGGELVDSNGNVVDFIDATANNPFILTAPQSGEYTINAGYKKPALKWDSQTINLTPTGIGDADPAQAPLQIRLYPNYPNPFNPETEIAFLLPRAGEIQLAIYNVQGQKVRTLAEGRYPAGLHTFKWNGRDDREQPVPSGVYLYELRSSDQRLVRKMILMK